MRKIGSAATSSAGSLFSRFLSFDRALLSKVAIGCAGIAMIGLALAAHRLRLGHNPKLRWTKAALYIFGLGLMIAAVRLYGARWQAYRVVRDSLAYLAIISLTVAAAVHPLGLAADPNFQWKRQLLLAFGLCMSGLAILLPVICAFTNGFFLRETRRCA